jgi:hypothetical protein
MKDYFFSLIQIYYHFIVTSPFLNIFEFVGKTNVCNFWNQNIGIISIFEEDIYEEIKRRSLSCTMYIVGPTPDP